ncbi:hypothetical protein B0H14DRAFT_854843 [Mycena olivaceomarginata]|nr:hypothetical protein B0H14DRAFT_114736 [Mycena olivaceomarginata]KAJ7893695.1 hypothetical protein B0H14DRAFT_854843 [Mycena olivaceomarginata]
MRNHYVSLLLSASNLWAAAQAGPPLDARQQTSSEGSSPSSSPSMSSSSSSPSSPVILGNHVSSSLLHCTGPRWNRWAFSRARRFRAL